MVNWYYSTNDQERIGPISAVQLKQMAAQGELRPQDLVWREGLPQWVQARSVKDLFAAVRPSEPPPLPPRRDATGDASDGSSTSTAGTKPPPPVANRPSRHARGFQWYYEVDGHKAGPVLAEELLKLAEDGFVTLDTLLWRQDLPYWIPARSVPELEFADHYAAPPEQGDSNMAPRSRAHTLIRVYSGISIAVSILGIVYSLLIPFIPAEELALEPGTTRDEVLAGAFVVFVLSAISVPIAIALWRFKKWAWIVSVVLAIISLLWCLGALSFFGALVTIAGLVLLYLGRSACGITLSKI